MNPYGGGLTDISW